MGRDRWKEYLMTTNALHLDTYAHDSFLERSLLGRRMLDDTSAPAPPPTPPTQQQPTGFATPDPIVVIILGILLFALICAAFLNSILRCLLRRQRLRAWQAAAMAAAANGQGGFPGSLGPGGDGNAAAHGLDLKILHSLPVLEFLKNESSSTENLRVGDCSICLSEFSEKEKLRLLPKCSHIFHLECIDMWLQSHTSCPVCRDTIVSCESLPTHGQTTIRLRQEENGESLVAMGAAASAAGPAAGMMLLIQDENGHSVAASGSMRRDAPSFHLVATNPNSIGGKGVGSSRRSFVLEVSTSGGGQQDEHCQALQLMPLVQANAAGAAGASNLNGDAGIAGNAVN